MPTENTVIVRAELDTTGVGKGLSTLNTTFNNSNKDLMNVGQRAGADLGEKLGSEFEKRTSKWMRLIGGSLRKFAGEWGGIISEIFQMTRELREIGAVGGAGSVKGSGLGLVEGGAIAAGAAAGSKKTGIADVLYQKFNGRTYNVSNTGYQTASINNIASSGGAATAGAGILSLVGSAAIASAVVGIGFLLIRINDLIETFKKLNQELTQFAIKAKSGSKEAKELLSELGIDQTQSPTKIALDLYKAINAIPDAVKRYETALRAGLNTDELDKHRKMWFDIAELISLAMPGHLGATVRGFINGFNTINRDDKANAEKNIKQTEEMKKAQEKYNEAVYKSNLDSLDLSKTYDNLNKELDQMNAALLEVDENTKEWYDLSVGILEKKKQIKTVDEQIENNRKQQEKLKLESRNIQTQLDDRNAIGLSDLQGRADSIYGAGDKWQDMSTTPSFIFNLLAGNRRLSRREIANLRARAYAGSAEAQANVIKSRTVANFENISKYLRGIGMNDLAQQYTRRADDIRSTIGAISTSERHPVAEQFNRLAEIDGEIARLLREGGVRVQVANGTGRRP